MDERQSDPDIGSVFGFSLSIALTTLLLFIAAANGVRDLTFFAGTTLALMLAARAWSRASLFRLEVAVALDRDRLFPGETFRLDADIRNDKLLPVWMRIEFPNSSPFLSAEGVLRGETALSPYERTTGTWTFRPERRGVYLIGAATLSAGDLLGLHRVERPIPIDREVSVFPRLVPIAELDLPFRDFFGIHPSRGIIEDPAWYEGTREYSGSRPARNIHWKASARLDVLQEKIFQPTSHRKVFFLLDADGFRRAEDTNGFESALEVIASLAVRFAESGASFAVAANCAVLRYPAILPLGRGPEHLGKTLELLARCCLERGASLPALLGGVAVTGAGFVVVSRAPDENAERFFALPAARRGRVLFLFAEDAEGESRTPLPSVVFRRLLAQEPEGGTESLVGELER